MTGSALPQIEDAAAVASRVQSIAIGVRLSVAGAVAGIAYALATWSQPHRATIVLLFVTHTAWALSTLAFGHERIVRNRRRELLLLGWSIGTILMIGALVAVDGGARSPLALLFFLPIAYAALSYPLPSVVAIAVADLIAFVVAGAFFGSVSQPYLGFFATSLAMTALLCAWVARDQDRRREALARISRADPLTGCLNRRGFKERLAAELDSGMRTDRRVGLVLLDLDDFKAVNDTRGHAAGDELLLWTVERAQSVLRPMDSLGRIGGDEFAIIVPGAGAAAAREVANRVRDALGERVSVSCGVASFPANGSDSDSLQRHADTDLYAEKHGRKPAPTSRELTWAAAFARAADFRMAVPDEHSSAVAHYAAAVAQRLGWSGAELALLRMAAMLHDVGKISVPDHVLTKPGPLTLHEYEQITLHPVAGAEIVEQIDGLAPIVDWIRHSHEHVDGSGYPDGLRGDEIPLASRILLVADAFDAMTSTRPYGGALPIEIALEELHGCAGRQFDGCCVRELESYLADEQVPAAVAAVGLGH
jgi:diguanylate cyclase (GGDEF)-like protein/putative nucleotidyltransferase with HDIG domain